MKTTTITTVGMQNFVMQLLMKATRISNNKSQASTITIEGNNQ